MALFEKILEMFSYETVNHFAGARGGYLTLLTGTSTLFFLIMHRIL